jgi:hypothetical protein
MPSFLWPAAMTVRRDFCYRSGDCRWLVFETKVHNMGDISWGGTPWVHWMMLTLLMACSNNRGWGGQRGQWMLILCTIHEGCVIRTSRGGGGSVLC